MVARRCTWVPMSREMTSVSASHSWGNSAATWATGQWCWHSCPPDAIVVAERSGRGAAPAWPEGLDQVAERRYGETTLWYAQRELDG